MTKRKNINKRTKDIKFRTVKQNISGITDVSFSIVHENQMFSQSVPLLSEAFSNSTINASTNTSQCSITNGSGNYSYIKKCIGIKLVYVNNSSPLVYKVDASHSSNKINNELIKLSNTIQDYDNYSFEVFSKSTTRITNDLTFVIKNGYLLVLDESIPGDTISYLKNKGDIDSHNVLYINCFIYNGKFGFKNTKFTGTEGIIIPSGTSSSGTQGSLRYNSNAKNIQGYFGNNWKNLAGVSDTDLNTKIELNETDITFYIGSNSSSDKKLTINENGIYLNVNSYSGNSVKLDGNVKVTGTVTGSVAISNVQNVPLATSSIGGVAKVRENNNSDQRHIYYTNNSGDIKINANLDANSVIDWTSENAGTIHDSNYNKATKATTDSIGVVKVSTDSNYYNVQFSGAGRAYVTVPWGQYASNSTVGYIKVGYTQNAKKYPVRLSSDKAYVNVPWVDTTYSGNGLIDWTVAQSTPIHASNYTNTTYSAATSSTLGLIKVGYTENGKNYAVNLSGTDKQAYITVPWVDTTYSENQVIDWTVSQASNNKIIHPNNYINTTEVAATAGSGGHGLIKVGYTENGKNYPVEVTSESGWRAFVNVPWTDSGVGVGSNRLIDWTAANAGTIHAGNYTRYGNASSTSAGVCRTKYPTSGTGGNYAIINYNNYHYAHINNYVTPTWTAGTYLDADDTVYIDDGYMQIYHEETGKSTSRKPCVTMERYTSTKPDANDGTDQVGVSILFKHQESNNTEYSQITSYACAPSSQTLGTDNHRRGTALAFFVSDKAGTGQEVLRVNESGFVGINDRVSTGVYSGMNATPYHAKFPLTVQSANAYWGENEGYSTRINNGQHSYWSGLSLNNFSKNWTSSWSSNWPVTAWFEYTVYCANIMFLSDERIKKNISDFSNNEALEILRKIPSKQYTYKDFIKKRSTKTIGFIAQEVQEVFPSAINVSSDFIPDKQEVIDNSNLIWEECKVDDETKYLLTINNYDISSNTRVRFHVSKDVYDIDSDSNIREERFDLRCRNDGKFLFDTSYSTVFIYGKEIGDLLRVDKNQIYTLHHPAIQALDEQQEKHKLELETLVNRIQQLENEKTSILEELQNFTNRVQLLE